MIWLYWNRWRPAILAAVVCVSCLAVLVIVAGSLAPDGEVPSVPGSAASAQPRTGGMARPIAPPVNAASAAQVQRGLTLMSGAVAACGADSYSGTQMTVWWSSAGSSTYLIKVWHRQRDVDLEIAGGYTKEIRPPGLGQGTMTATASRAEGVLSLSGTMLDLMQSNYQIAYSGTGSAVGRPAEIVTVRRDDGTLAARYWLDAATSLPLRREIFDSSGNLVNEGAFIDLQVGDPEVGTVPPVAGRSWSIQPAEPAVAGLRARGWQVPTTLAGNLVLFALTKTSSRSGEIVDASYSDGLSVVSIFIQRGQLTASMAGWRKAAIEGQTVLSGQADNRTLIWSAGGFVYTVIADAPAQTVSQVVAELPHDQAPGFWQRVGRGLKRIGSWLNPFG